MTELLELIKSTHLQRISDIHEQKKVWFRLSEKFNPDIKLYRTGRPSVIIAGETGDLGLSVLWIVQATLTRPILNEIILKSEDDEDLSLMLGKINQNSLCALAHSESPKEPVVLSKTAGGYLLNGEKKFITAGKNSGMMFVTCRMPGDEKISRMAVINTAELPADSLPELELPIMKSVSHTKLVLKDTAVQNFQVPRIDPAFTRRMIKKYGILERALILESFLSFLLYAEKSLFLQGIELSPTGDIQSLIEMQSVSVAKQIDEAVYNDRIETENIGLNKLFPLIDIFKKAYIKAEHILPETEKVKLRDLFLFDSLKG